jgi:hypothetical protein
VPVGVTSAEGVQLTNPPQESSLAPLVQQAGQLLGGKALILSTKGVEAPALLELQLSLTGQGVS